MAADVAQRFCASVGIAPDRWRVVAFRRALYPHARLLRPLLTAMNAEFFAADHDFVEGVGRLARPRDFLIEADEFAHHPDNRGFLRRGLRLRVSVRRMQSLLVASFADEAGDASAVLRLR